MVISLNDTGLVEETALHNDPPADSYTNKIHSSTYISQIDSQAIQILSDLHLEHHFNLPDGLSVAGYSAFHFPAQAPNLALLGDIGHAVHEGFFAFLERQLVRFDRVFFVMGNHEGFGGTYEAARAKLEYFQHQNETKRLGAESSGLAHGQFIFLNRTRYDLSDRLTILGCTLWSGVPQESAEAVSLGLSDFRQVANWTLTDHVAAHAGDLAWLNAECARVQREEPERDVVIFTHHAPTVSGTAPPEHENSAIGSGFATELVQEVCWRTPSVKVWGFGHTHYSCDFVRQGVRVVSNQRGYEKNRDGRRFKLFDPNKVIVV